MSASQRRKGHDFERQVARDLTAAGVNASRGLQSQGEVVPDVIAPALWIECKRGIQPSPRAALRQAEAAAHSGRIPVAIIRDDRERAFVAMRYDDWVEMYTQWLKAREI